MVIPLQGAVVYGPLNSRRFGKSLGINLLPTDTKACFFDCVYCQYGGTGARGQAPFPGLKKIENEVRSTFSDAREKNLEINWIMIAGNGEPTIHPDFAKVVELLIALRDEYLCGVPLGILSNSAMVYKSSVRDALMKLDGRFMKLDAGGERMFKVINRPLSRKIDWDMIVEGLRCLRGVTLQSMFITGSFDNTSEKSVEEWVKVVRNIGPEDMQVYTVERPTTCAGILPVPKYKLERIAENLTRKTGVPSFVYK